MTAKTKKAVQAGHIRSRASTAHHRASTAHPSLSTVNLRANMVSLSMASRRRDSTGSLHKANTGSRSTDSTASHLRVNMANLSPGSMVSLRRDSTANSLVGTGHRNRVVTLVNLVSRADMVGRLGISCGLYLEGG